MIRHVCGVRPCPRPPLKPGFWGFKLSRQTAGEMIWWVSEHSCYTSLTTSQSSISNRQNSFSVIAVERFNDEYNKLLLHFPPLHLKIINHLKLFCPTVCSSRNNNLPIVVPQTVGARSTLICARSTSYNKLLLVCTQVAPRRFQDNVGQMLGSPSRKSCHVKSLHLVLCAWYPITAAVPNMADDFMYAQLYLGCSICRHLS